MHYLSLFLALSLFLDNKAFLLISAGVKCPPLQSTKIVSVKLHYFSNKLYEYSFRKVAS
jgi:hypothetical protein